MPVYLDDPSALTKERLKSELRAHNVELPGGNPTKDVYVQLYVKTVSAQSHGAEALDAFSSDEELSPPVVSQTRRSRSSGRKSEAALEQMEMAQMSDEDLRDQLLKHGVHAGPIVASTRTLYEKKLLKLQDNGAILSESQSHSNSGEAEVYSDQEEELPAAPEPEPTAHTELEPVPVKSSSSCPTSAQRHSSSQHSITKVEKMTAEPPPSEEDTALPELSTFTGLMATCRQPIKGAASHPVIRDTQSFESQNSVCNSAPTTTCSAPFTTSPTPSAASSAFSSASSPPSTACQAKARDMSWWKKLLLLVILVVFVFLVFQAMEPYSAAPSEQAEEL